MPELPAGTVTFLFTEITGSASLWEQSQSAMAAALTRHHSLLHEAVVAHHGVVFKTVGDGGHAVFSRAPNAVVAAVTAQRAFQTEPWTTTEPLHVRMALHTGSAEPHAGDYLGQPLNQVTRLLGAAHGGQILLSSVTAELVRDQLPPDLTLRDLGLHRLRDLSRPQPIFQLAAPDLPMDFLPLDTLDPHLHNLPAQANALVDREWETTNIHTLLRRDDVRLMTLTGPGGVGKTRLALHAAAALLDQFSHGVYFIKLAPISAPSMMTPTIAQALGVKATGMHTLVDTLKEYLASQQILLVLDNFEHVMDAALLVGELLNVTAQLKIMVTSRSLLRLSAEHEFKVLPLTLPDRSHLPPYDRLEYYPAVRLLVERAQTVRPGFRITPANAAAVAEICHRLDGLPLAIELAAARCKLFSPAALLERLSSPFTVLTGGPRDLPDRQQNLQATIEWSYNLLASPEQKLLARLAVFSGGCTFEAVEVVCGEDANPTPAVSHATPAAKLGSQIASVLDSIALLLDQSLLQQFEDNDNEPRFLLLETIRQYALARLEANREVQVMQQRHAAYYLALAELANSMLQGPTQGTWLVQLEVEHDNLRAALAWYKVVEPEQGLRLAAALARFWEMHSHLSEGRTWLEEMLQISTGADATLRARAYNGSGALAHWQGDYQQATLLLQEGLALFNSLHDNTGAAQSLRGLGLVAWFQGDHTTARTQLEASAERFRAVEHTWGIADALHWLGHVALDQGDTATAYALFAQSLALFRETGDNRNIALPLKDFGLIASLRGDQKTARVLYEESLALSRSVADTWHIAETLQRLGDQARLQADYERAARLGQESLELWRKLDNKGGIAETFNLLGTVAQLQGIHSQATAHYTESLALLRTMGSKRIIASVLHNLGKVAQLDHHDARAAALYQESLALNHEIGYTPGIADCFVGLATLAVVDGFAARAAQLLGAVEPHLDTIRGYMPLTDRANYEQMLATVRAQLGEAAFSVAFAQGRQRKLDQAIAFAQAQPQSPEERTQLLKIVATPAVYPARLTKREVEILRLVAQGLTDAQVADRLVISPRTVNGHLSSIYNKLGVTSRTAATHYAITYHLV